jgi:GAF domain-containing protein/CheY-like chemotaxis protein/two-component sensor histidine kinase
MQQTHATTITAGQGFADARAASGLDESIILLVDDHTEDLPKLEAALAPLGEPLRHVPSGPASLPLLEDGRFAVVLLDDRVPPASRLALGARLRQNPTVTPIIFLIGDSAAAEPRLPEQDRSDIDFLVRRSDLGLLRSKVRVFVELHRQRRDLERLTALRERERLISRQRVQILAAVAARLSPLLTLEEVAQVVTTEAHDALTASTSALYALAEGGGGIVLMASRASGAERRAASKAARAELPALVQRAVQQGEPLWLDDREGTTDGAGAGDSPGQRALVALPLRVGARCIGALAFGFDVPKSWDQGAREFLVTLAAQFSAALERARLLGNERQAYRELQQRSDAMRLLADAGTLLSSSLEYEPVLRQLSEIVVPVVADWCAIDVLDQAGHIRRLSAFHSDPAKVALAHEIERAYPEDPQSDRGVPNVLRTGKTEWMAEIPESLLSAAARDDEHLRLIRQLGLRSYVVVPLKARERIVGALSLIYAESGRSYSQEDVRFIEELAARAALSVDNALLFKQQVDARERLERQTRQALLMGDVGAALTRSESLEQALQRCAEAMVRHLGAAFARIWTSNPRESVLELQSSAGIYTHVDGPHCRVPIGKFKIGRIAESAAPHLTNDVQNDPWVSDPAWARREGMVAFAGYPLIINGKVLGVMAMFARHPLADDTLTALSTIADAVAIGIERSRADLRAREERDTLEAVNEVGRALAAELDREKLVQAVTESATKLAGAAFGAFFYNVMNESAESYMLYAIAGVPREEFSKFPMPRNTQVFAPTFAGEGVVRVHDIRKDPRYGHNEPHHGMPHGHLPVASYLAVPVVSRTGSVIGGLFFGHPEPGMFSERSQMLVEGVAAQAAVAMDNARLFREAQRLITQLDKTNKELDQFAYVASHDLKAPLRGIANLSQWLEEDLGDAITEDGKTQLNLLRSRVNRMEGLINGILDYSRAGRVRAKPELIATDKLLAEVVELSAASKGARIDIQPNLPELRTERVPLQQVFMNLIGNALKHAKRADPHVQVNVRDLGELFEFSVRDNGPGIAPEFHERIWGVFQTLEPRDTVESTGIGLSVVKKIVESKGGRAWVESAEGAGATFCFTWPKQEAVTSV